MKLIGIAGTNGSGKDTLAAILAKDFGFLDVSVSDFLRAEAKTRGLPIEREYLRQISAEWRREYGLGVLVDKAVELFEQSGGKYIGVVANPMRNPGEARHLKDLGGILIWVDADPKIRYQRIYSRKRSAEDNKTFEQFLAEEHDEMDHHGGDEYTPSGAGVKELASIFLENDGNDLDLLKITAQKALGL